METNQGGTLKRYRIFGQVIKSYEVQNKDTAPSKRFSIDRLSVQEWRDLLIDLPESSLQLVLDLLPNTTERNEIACRYKRLNHRAHWWCDQGLSLVLDGIYE